VTGGGRTVHRKKLALVRRSRRGGGKKEYVLVVGKKGRGGGGAPLKEGGPYFKGRAHTGEKLLEKRGQTKRKPGAALHGLHLNEPQYQCYDLMGGEKRGSALGAPFFRKRDS